MRIEQDNFWVEEDLAEEEAVRIKQLEREAEALRLETTTLQEELAAVRLGAAQEVDGHVTRYEELTHRAHSHGTEAEALKLETATLREELAAVRLAAAQEVSELKAKLHRPRTRCNPV